MSTARFTIALLLASLLYVENTASKPKETVKVSVYYESLLPSFINFFIDQLYPTYQKLGEYLTLDLIPYGRTNTTNQTGSWVFSCRHGPRECLFNKLQICGFLRTEDEALRLNYAVCMANGARVTSYRDLTEKCAPLLNVIGGKIWKCARGDEGNQLLAKMGRKTKNQGVVGVPTIIFNDSHDDALQAEALVNFYKTVCKLLRNEPKECRVQQDDEILKITVYYEALCPDSIRFITKQLYPTYTKIGRYLNVDLVPYGKATQTMVNNKWIFNCQHGPEECQANKQQACGLEKTSNQNDTIEFINCVMDFYAPGDEDNVEKCASNSHISGEAVIACSKSKKGDEYLARYGDQTHALTPKLAFVPTVVFNDVYDSKIQHSSLSDLLRTACKALSYKPSECSRIRGFGY